MSLPHGTHLNGVRNLDDLLGRCVLNQDTGCWHLRRPGGRKLLAEKRRVPKVYVHQKGNVVARRFGWEQANGPVPEGHVIGATCTTFDCVNPAHTKCCTRAELGKVMERLGKTRSPAKAAACLRQARARPSTRLTEELAQWIRESQQTQRDIAHAFEMRQGQISDVVLGKTWRPSALVSSVFAWRPL